ncbi:hypothetical protein LTR84_010951 [Exophiala bonariae]|uniref:dipeptidyl-peptidase IV n=1 Tax=Exophiala bonariae TaxID=1690606 RepID=A0AAV9NID9_9EURO|nr:hypothetical protein LTR84_010951 [Exophiala bonariae]
MSQSTAASEPTTPDLDPVTANTERLKDAYTNTSFDPKWIKGSDHFWYHSRLCHNKSSFIYVDAHHALRAPAFDHTALAEALNSQGIHADATNLPFTHVDASKDCKTIKFRIGEKKFRFQHSCLTEYDGDLTQESLQPLKQEKVSEGSATRTNINFVNELKESVSIFWIDFQGDEKHYSNIQAGESQKQSTYEGHVWRVAKSEGNEAVATFVANGDDSIAIIKTGLIPAIPVGKAQDATTTESGEIEDNSTNQTERRFQLFIKDHNLWLHTHDDGDLPLSSTATSGQPFNADKIFISPNDQHAVAFQHTFDQDRTLYHIESSPKTQRQPRLKQTQYLKPGDRRRVDRPRLFDLTRRVEVETDDCLFPNPYRINSIGWNSDGSEFRFEYNRRGHQVLRVVGMATNGTVRTLIEDTSNTFIDYSQKSYHHHINDTDELIWASERDGWNHLYLFDLGQGKLKNQITKGEWVVRSVDHVDNDRKQIWFTALGLVADQDPYHSHLARINYDGSGLVVLTEGDGTHTWKWSPSRIFLVDTWSRVDLAPRTVLRAADTGKAILTLEEGDFQTLPQTGWQPAQRLAAPGRDGHTMIYGIMVLPLTFDPLKRYPIIEDIYAGPQDFFVPKSFSPLIRQHTLAAHGFIVVHIDGMGTNWRGKAFHDTCHQNLRDAGFPDRIAWLTAAAATRPWMDVTRVGIFGSSAGGQSALAALLWHGDLYRAAVADSGCHDNRLDKLWWNEAWMGWPVDENVYDASSNVVHANRLQGALMLIVGELDDNVDPASTMQVVDALIKADKDFDLVFVPGAGHGVGYSSAYCLRRQRDFFIRHLLGKEPPDRNAG